jgi:hypothetical protein
MTSPLDTPEAKAAIADLAEVILGFVPTDEIDSWTLRYLGDPAGLDALHNEIHAGLGGAADPGAGVVAYVFGKMIFDRARKFGAGGHA